MSLKQQLFMLWMKEHYPNYFRNVGYVRIILWLIAGAGIITAWFSLIYGGLLLLTAAFGGYIQKQVVSAQLNYYIDEFRYNKDKKVTL